MRVGAATTTLVNENKTKAQSPRSNLVVASRKLLSE
jgi:hypothetical protein